MPAVALWSDLNAGYTCELSKEEMLIVEAELFVHLHEALKEIVRAIYKNYFQLMKLNPEEESCMLEERFIRCIINDILVSEEYTLTGIARYTQIPEDLLYDISTGYITDISSTHFKKIIVLHRSVRPDLYREMMKKITSEYVSQASQN